MSHLSYKGAKVLWIDFLANGPILIEEEKRNTYIQNAKHAGFTHVVVDAKIPYGYVTYKSTIAPHVGEWQRFSEWKNKDYVSIMIEEMKKANLQVLLKFDVFAEGSIVDSQSKAHEQKDWQVTYYHAEKKSAPIFTKAEEYEEQSIFVNPIHPDVQAYELSLIKEATQLYDVDAVVLDRCRYPNVYGDFSELSKVKFEEHIGKQITDWPQSILTPTNDGFEPGTYYKKWITWRASNITHFVEKAKNVVKTINEELDFGIYVGSWYPTFFEEGVNWGSKDHIHTFEWMDEAYKKTGYADLLDFLITGCYYSTVTKEEAKANAKVDWKSVEGAIQLSKEVAGNCVPIIAGLFLQEYEKKEDKYIDAMKVCLENSDGMMIFDAIYLEKYNWWKKSAEKIIETGE